MKKVRALLGSKAAIRGEEEPERGFPTLLGTACERVLVACVLLFLAVTSLATVLTTGYLQNYTESIEYSSAAAPVVVVGMVAVFVAFAVLDRAGALERIDEGLITKILVAYTLVFGIVWAYLIARSFPDWDSREMFITGRDYLTRFSYQIPFSALCRLANIVSLGHGYEVMEGFNIVMTAWSSYLLVALARELFESKRVTVVTALLCFFFLPPLFNVTFIYPNVMSVALALLAFLLQVRSLRQGSLKLALLSIAAAFLSYYFKSSMLLAVASMAVVWVVHALRRRSWGNLVLCAALMAVCLAGNKVSQFAVEQLTGIEADQVMPAEGYVVMGLTESANNPGWYTGYVWEIPFDEYSQDAVREAARPELRTLVDGFLDDPAYAWRFFSEKYCSEWTEPTNESILSSNWSYSSGPTVPVMAERAMSPVARAIYYGPVNTAIVTEMDIMQSAIMCAAAVCVWTRRKDLDISRMAPVLCAAGTGLFYVVWEAKSQYVLHAYTMLIPFAAAGIVLLLNRVGTQGKREVE